MFLLKNGKIGWGIAFILLFLLANLFNEKGAVEMIFMFYMLAAGGQALGFSNMTLLVFFLMLLVWYFLTFFFKIHTNRAKCISSSSK